MLAYWQLRIHIFLANHTYRYGSHIQRHDINVLCKALGPKSIRLPCGLSMTGPTCCEHVERGACCEHDTKLEDRTWRHSMGHKGCEKTFEPSQLVNKDAISLWKNSGRVPNRKLHATMCATYNNIRRDISAIKTIGNHTEKCIFLIYIEPYLWHIKSQACIGPSLIQIAKVMISQSWTSWDFPTLGKFHGSQTICIISRKRHQLARSANSFLATSHMDIHIPILVRIAMMIGWASTWAHRSR